jgi:hypothetical protein
MACGGLCVLIAIALFCVFPAGPSMAAEFKMDPYLIMREEYNDNIFLDYSSSRKEDAFITRVLPGIEASYRTEQADLRLSGKLQQSWYSRLSELDGLDQYYSGSLNYTFTPSFSMSGRAGYTIDSQPDRDILETGLILFNYKRQRQTYGATGTYVINEKTLSSLSYDYSKDSYFANDSDLPAIYYSRYDIESNSVNLGFIRDLGALGPGPLQGRMNLGYNRYRYTGTTVDNYMATVGVSSDIHEKWNVLIDAGVRRNETNFTFLSLGPTGFVEQDRTDRGWGWVLQSTLSYKERYGTAKLRLSHDLVPAGGSTGVTERTGAFLDLTYRFTYELSGTFSTAYIRNKAERGDFGTLGINEDTYYFTPGLRYAFTKDISIDASYNFLRNKDKRFHTDAERNLFLIQLRMQHSLFD